MNLMTSWLFKKKVSSFIDDDEPDKKSSDLVDVYEKVENGIKDSAQKLKDWLKGKKCVSAGCDKKPEADSVFCKYHKCHKCEKKRAMNTIYCIEHRSA